MKIVQISGAITDEFAYNDSHIIKEGFPNPAF